MSRAAVLPPSRTIRSRSIGHPVLPGLLLCIAVALLALALERIEVALFGRAWLEALVLAILAGTAIRTAWAPPEALKPGIRFSAKFLLEVAVVLLGASVSAAVVLASGPALLASIAGIVVIAIVASFAIGRLLGLPVRMALLVACGNSICGNSAIAAVAPIIDADGDDVAAAIAFTAVLGVAVVLGLPLLAMALHMTALQYGALAGLTVYAVPQVIAAAAPFGASAIQAGTLIKLVRVLMLGPVCLVLSLLGPRLGTQPSDASRPSVTQLVPWFILGFLALMAARSFGWLPEAFPPVAARVATLLTILSMAALGLGVDIRTVARAGSRVTTTVILSLLVLGAMSLAVIRLLGL